jgi:hypothetical protein
MIRLRIDSPRVNNRIAVEILLKDLCYTPRCLVRFILKCLEY